MHALRTKRGGDRMSKYFSLGQEFTGTDFCRFSNFSKNNFLFEKLKLSMSQVPDLRRTEIFLELELRTRTNYFSNSNSNKNLELFELERRTRTPS